MGVSLHIRKRRTLCKDDLLSVYQYKVLHVAMRDRRARLETDIKCQWKGDYLQMKGQQCGATTMADQSTSIKLQAPAQSSMQR